MLLRPCPATRQWSTNLVVVVEQRAAQEHDDAGVQLGDGGAEAREAGHGGSAHGRVLQDDAVVDVPDVPAKALLDQV